MMPLIVNEQVLKALLPLKQQGSCFHCSVSMALLTLAVERG